MNDFSDMLSKAKKMQDKMKELQDSLKKIESTSCLIEVQTESDDYLKIHEEIVTHIKEMQASATFKL